jgi:hypothetical protein
MLGIHQGNCAAQCCWPHKLKAVTCGTKGSTAPLSTPLRLSVTHVIGASQSRKQLMFEDSVDSLTGQVATTSTAAMIGLRPYARA